MVKIKLNHTKPTTKGIAKKIPPKRGTRSYKKKADAYGDRDAYVKPPRRTNNGGILDNATNSFSATASGNAYVPDPSDGLDGLELDANGGIEIRTGDTPAGLFSPREGEGWNMPYTPEHVSESIEHARVDAASPERDLNTPEPRALDRMFTPDGPETTMTKKTITRYTRFVTDHGENVPGSAQEGNYTGPSITAVVVKTVVPCYIVQMPQKVRAKIYSYVLFPNGKDKTPRPHFSGTNTWRVKPPALLQTCQQLRKEATRVYYSNVMVTCASIAAPLPWLQMLSPAARAAIGKIKVPFDPWNHVDKTKDQQIRLALRELRKAGVEVKRPKFDLVVSERDVDRSMGGDLTDDE